MKRCFSLSFIEMELTYSTYRLWALIPGLQKSPGEGNGNPLQYSCLGNPVDRGAWRAIVHGIEKESDVTQPLLLLLLSCFSLVRLCATPWTAAHQAPPSLGFSRQEHRSGLPFPSPTHESEKWKVKVKSLSRVPLPATPWTAAHQAPPSMGFSRQEYWSGVPLPSPTIQYTNAFIWNLERWGW